jgi:hypothetical protein
MKSYEYGFLKDVAETVEEDEDGTLEQDGVWFRLAGEEGVLASLAVALVFAVELTSPTAASLATVDESARFEDELDELEGEWRPFRLDPLLLPVGLAVFEPVESGGDDITLAR